MKRFDRTILATCCLPWDDEGKLDEPAFHRHLTDIVHKGTRDVYLFGTAGEGYAVGDGQFREIVDKFAVSMKELDGRPMIGVISLSTNTVIERIEYGLSRGIRRFQLSLPSWGACTFPEAERFFAMTCGRFPEGEFLHYNTPRTGRVLSPQEYGILAAAHPNLVATKNGNDSLHVVAELHRYAPELRHFLTGFSFAAASLLGLDAGYLISRAVINWDHAKRYFDACLRQDSALIASYVDQFITMGEGFKEIVPGKSHMDGGYDKLFPMFADPDFSPRLLPPYGSTDEESFHQLKEYIAQELPDWLP